jgi:hypothetical protein
MWNLNRWIFDIAFSIYFIFTRLQGDACTSEPNYRYCYNIYSCNLIPTILLEVWCCLLIFLSELNSRSSNLLEKCYKRRMTHKFALIIVISMEVKAKNSLSPISLKCWPLLSFLILNRCITCFMGVLVAVIIHYFRSLQANATMLQIIHESFHWLNMMWQYSVFGSRANY